MGKDPYKYFRVEARELLDDLTRLVTELDKGVAAPGSVAKLLRLAHTLKGASQVVRQTAIAGMAHAIEDILCPFRDTEGPVSELSTAEVLRLLDQIAAKLDELGPSPGSKVVTSNKGTASIEPLKTVRVDVTDVEALLSALSEAAVQVTTMQSQAGTMKEIKQLASAIARYFSHPDPRQNGSAGRKVRAHAEQLLGCVVRLEQVLVSAVERTGRELLTSQERAHRLRLLPVETIFPSLERAVRDVALELGKQASFETSALDLRLDAEVLAVLGDALLQLVRNAVAHGIEKAEARIAAGKSSVGKIEVTVQRKGGRINVSCRDDGAGFDVEAIRRAAVKKGSISALDAESMGLNDAINLILRGGVSTTKAVTGISGRGIGLDVVRDAVQRLNGDLSVDTVPGVGSTVQMCVPVSLNSLNALIVESAGMRVCIPMDSVRQTLRISRQDIAHPGHHQSIPYKHQSISFLRLSQALGRPNSGSNGCAREAAVVVACGEAIAAVGVDKILGARTILVHSVSPMTAADPIVSGGALDAAGDPLLVINPAELVKEVQRGDTAVVGESEARRLPILIIDDSLTTRMVEQNILESAGHQVKLASSAEEALEMARAHKYAMFLVDVEMPGMDGFQFLKRAREDPQLREIPSILVTSCSAPEDQRRGAEAGARAYIVKGDFDQRHFLATVNQLLN
ncbi:MAG: response regulator [Terriglobales bacterium]|jgi:two-component system chemotaxis sensor kinase CheA